MDKYSFTRKYLPAARMAGELYGLNPVVILAQSAIETGWGESSLATCYNNFFGLTGYGVANAYCMAARLIWINRTVCCFAVTTVLKTVSWILPA